jgi:Leucine-rich repeat (LRR) protein
MMDTNNIAVIDLTTVERISYDREEDRAAFSRSRAYRQLYKKQVHKLKQNDANCCMLNGRDCGDLSEDVCDRIGFYLWRNSHLKNISLNYGNGLSAKKMKKLFSRIVDQHKQNELNDDIRKVGVLEEKLNVGDASLTDHVLGYLSITPFTQLLHVNVSHNSFGTNGLDVLVKAIAGAPVKELRMQSCGLHDLSPLIVGARNLKELKVLDLSSNSLESTAANASALMVLFDGGYPRQRELNLNGCCIDSELIKKSAPALLSNRKLWYLLLNGNSLGDMGASALFKVICDSTSFENILGSNHTILKIPTMDDQTMSPASGNALQRLSMINFNFHGKQEKGRAACRKLFSLLADYDNIIDPSIFLRFDIGLVPLIFFKLLDRTSYPLGASEVLTAIYKILRCKLFRERLELSSKAEATRIKNEQLEAANATLLEENKRLKEQVVSLMAQNRSDTRTNYFEVEQIVGSVAERSIAERVKMRAKRRKHE